MKYLGAGLVWVVCLAGTVFGWTEETGTLRGFLQGHCPTCGYDNWASHVVEGLALPGYNDYGPAWFDPQMNGFGHFTYLAPNDTAADRTLSNWRVVFNAAVNGQWDRVDSVLAAHVESWHYELVRLQDSELNRTFFILRERLDSSFVDPNVDSVATDDVTGSFDNGWGVYVFNTESVMPKFEIEVVHPDDDFMAIPIAIEIFIRTGGRALTIAGAGREVMWDTTKVRYDNSNTLSDPSRNGRLPLEICHEALFDLLDGGPTSPEVTLQMHSYDHYLHRSSMDIEVSAYADDNHPNPPLRDRAEHKDLIHFMGRTPVLGLPGYPTITRSIGGYVALLSNPAYSFYGTTDTVAISAYVAQPGAGGNKQATYSHRNHNTDRDPENFIHVEVDEYPNSLWSPEQWHSWLPGDMPPTTATFQLALAYYEPFIAAMDSSLRWTFLYPDTTPPTTVHLDAVTHAGADSVVLRWSPAAVDRFFDTYILYYDTVEINANSPTKTRLSSGFSNLTYNTTLTAAIRSLPRPASRYKFAVGSKDIYGNTAILSNSLGLSGGDVRFVLADAYMGNLDACKNDTLYLTFNKAGYRTGKTYVVLPSRLEVPWAPGTGFIDAVPQTNRAAYLSAATVRRLGTNTSDTLEVNVAWAEPYSQGDSTHYIACIPIHNQSAAQTMTLTIGTRDTTVFTNADGPQVNQFMVGPATVYNDCTPPTAALAYCNPPECAFGSAAALQGKFSVMIGRGTVPANSPLASAFVEVNGNAAQRVTVFNSLQAGDYADDAFPDSTQVVQLWSYLSEGCNNMVLHAFDTECNETISAAIPVAKDVTAPALTITNSDTAFCYTNQSGTAHYGGTALNGRLHINIGLGSNTCAADSGRAIVRYGIHSFVIASLPPDLISYPATESAATELWTWIAGVVSPLANGERFTFDVDAEDCGGNVRTVPFDLHIDLTPVANTLVELDARPTDMGVWLHWQWTYDPAQAVTMEVWRSNYSGDYPAYATNRWADLTDGTDYPRGYPPAGFCKVVEQNGTSGTSSAEYHISNGKERLRHGGQDSSYWLDEDSSWHETHPQRDIYRYITFVKDSTGDVSVVSAYTLSRDADRATNYWLGDFTCDAQVDPEGSGGIVNTSDLTLLSAHYFSSVPPAPAYFDIGPENHENGIGKGIPMPDGQIGFADLVPFSLNFGTTGPNVFMSRPTADTMPLRLDEPPRVKVVRADSIPIGVGGDFAVRVVLEGNSVSAIRALEAHLSYDADVLEFVSAATETPVIDDGVPFVTAKNLPGQDATVGLVVAAMGESAHLEGEGMIGRFTFHWKNKRAASTPLVLKDLEVADVSGRTLNATTQDLMLNALNAIPVQYGLYQNFPNPFNPSTRIRFDVPEDGHVRLEIFNYMGQHVTTLVNEYRAAAAYTVMWEGQNDFGQRVAAGVYIVRMQAGKFVDAKKMVMLK